VKIIIDAEFKNLLPALSNEESAGLEASLVAEGCRDSLIVWEEEGILLDGHNRWGICEKHGINYEIRKISLPDRDAAMDWIDANQAARRNITPDQLRLIRGRRYNRLKKKAHGREDRTFWGAQFGPPKTYDSLAEEYGVSKNTIKRDAKFAEEVENTPELKKAVNEGKLISRVIRELRQKKREVRIAEQSKNASAGAPVVQFDDALEWLSKQEPADLLLTDPPYSTDLEDVKTFVQSWLPLALTRIKSTGRAFICIGAYPLELLAYLSTSLPEQVLVWTYRNTLGPSPLTNYKQNWQAILYFKGDEAAPLNCPMMIEQFSVQDIPAPDGRQGDRYHKWQKPLELGERFIQHTTEPGDTVIDPFCCTGTFLIAAARLGRKAKGCDNNMDSLKIAQERGCVLDERSKKE